MALSNYEKRVLDEIEELLSGDDPRLASSLRNPRPLHRVRRGLLLSTGWIAGLLLAVFVVVDVLRYRAEPAVRTSAGPVAPIRIRGPFT